MTDYLEELLEQQEEEQNAMPEWHKRGRRLWSGLGLKTADALTVHQQQTDGSWTESTRHNAQSEPDESGQARQQSLVWQLDQVRRAVRQVQGQNGRMTVLSQTAVPQKMEHELRGFRLPARRAADYAAAVDAAFQRDARRYDGPLGLP